VNRPKVGSHITVTINRPTYYYYAKNPTITIEYQGIVEPPEPWYSSHQFRLSSDDPRVPFRTIDLQNVEKIVDGTGKTSVKSTISQLPNDMRVISIKGSKGNFYNVTMKGNRAISCTCTGFSFRKSCRHLKEAENLR